MSDYRERFCPACRKYKPGNFIKSKYSHKHICLECSEAEDAAE